MEIRKVTQTDDFNAISRIYALSWKEAYKNIVPQQYLDGLAENWWADKLSNKNNPYDVFVMIENGEYIGASSVYAARDETMDGWGEIVSIYLLPEYFGKGYGKPLFDNSVSALLNKGYDKIYLWTLEENMRARKFYEKCNFVFDGTKKEIIIGGKSLVEVRYTKICKTNNDGNLAK